MRYIAIPLGSLNPPKGRRPISTRSTERLTLGWRKGLNPPKGRRPISTEGNESFVSEVGSVSIPRRVDGRFPQLAL